MATTIKLKNSVTTTNAPSSLVQGEVAINITDKKVWVGNAATTPVQLLGDGGSASFTSIAFGAGTVSNPSITFTGDTNTGIYSPAADTIAFTEGGAEAMRIDSSGNVGIGTSSPSVALSIERSATSAYVQITRTGSANLYIGSQTTENVIISRDSTTGNLPLSFQTGSTERMRIDSSGNIGIGITPAANTRITLRTAATTDAAIVADNTLNSGFKVQFASNLTTILNDFNNPLAFGTNNTERMRIDSSGNVGIGVTAPTRLLHIDGGASATYFQMTNTASGRTNADGFQIAQDGTAVELINRENGYMGFNTNNTERMRITSGGELLVGTTDTNPNSGNGVKISAGTAARTSIVGSADTNANFAITVYSSSPAAYRFQVGYGGTIYATSTSITAISDATLKTNVKDLETGLTEIMALQPRRFDWINGDATNVAGFIAQEVQQVLPDLVEDYQYSDNETKLGLKMGDILPTLVKAIQEQQAMIEELTNRIKKLEGV